MDHKLEIEKIGLSSLKALQDISKNTFSATFGNDNSQSNMNKYLSQAFSVNKLTEELNNHNSFFYFGYIDSQLAGYLKLNINDAQTENAGLDSLEIQRIYILEEYKGMHLGSYFLKKADQLAKENYKKLIWLGGGAENPAALKFYQHKGFVRDGQHIFVLGNYKQTDFIMKKRLVN